MQWSTVISDTLMYRPKWPFLLKMRLAQQDMKCLMQELLGGIQCVMQEVRLDNHNDSIWP